ncbi:MAG: CAP domain-containing protein [Nitrospirales bacterium]|nr:CAP domain-containing protein [Nitrospirales bacterium]
MKPAYWIIAALIVISPCWSAAQGGAPHREPLSSLSEDRDDEKRILELVNEARMEGARCGSRYYGPTKPLSWNDRLANAALRQCRDMSRSRFLGHTGSDGSSSSDRVGDEGYNWERCAENVSEGYKTPEDAVNAWLKSEGHCRNIMNPEYRDAGVAKTFGKGWRPYWTLVLGREMR